MKNGYWITWSNQGGKLDSRFVETKEQTTAALIEMIGTTPLSAGDVIAVTEGESEE